MLGGKNIKLRGKLKLSQYFQELKEGDKVAIVREYSQQPKFPERIQGKSGIVEGKKGRAYIVKLLDGNEEKRFIIGAIHLKKLKMEK